MALNKLIQREIEENPIRVAIVGTGHMGGGTAHQISRMKGIEVSILAELDVEKAIKVYTINGIAKEKILVTTNPDAAQDAVQRGLPVVTEDSELAAKVAAVDAVVEATGFPEVGARVAYESIMGGKHVVMLNVEADVVIGSILGRLAKSAGVVYSIAAGDQPGAICEMYEWATTLGFEVIVAGRGTWSRPGCHYLTPDTFKDLEEQMGGSAKMYCSFHDGTKPNIEMAVTANILGLVPDIRGMHEPFVYVRDLHAVFDLKENGGILSRRGVVELANQYTPQGDRIIEGTVGKGVFLVVTSDHPIVQKNMKHLFSHIKGTGPNYALYRPYHLTCVETPNSIIRACLYGESTGTPREKPVAEVIAVAKKDLKAGEILDGGGGYTVYGQIESAEIARKEDLLPLGFAYNIPVARNIPKDNPVKYSDVTVDTGSFIYKLRQLQDTR
ncbi:MAG: NAD(P)-dependent oxidoreductase [Deltaproteobacteria bacterium]|nr:NAD(P)-dependent oxidoreductase [Deltaproteobacteria bacterium]MBW1960278.1 NAD(P)-dependent oxidoreductase [Deltaproteobacteria bacterium]MBW2150308.1 NAD(P)-dependent oxidoreductase [Deltaproteobacteria bacterium]